ncbi:EF-hand domain-containing protein [Marinoscillum furvescens]|uniref:EF-hand domain-containing protein n=1 Tax=Marinoscillum furvescens TaxID=1026 RepID=UPI001C868649|nr:hypothetical protein [Marinoscillum furvescens]
MRKQKLVHLFNILDTNKNALLQPDDFTAVAEKISDKLQYGAESKERLDLKSHALRLYVQLLTDMEKEEVSISLDEWLQLFGSWEIIHPASAKKYIYRIASYVFSLFDQNRDRVISKLEYLAMFEIYNIDMSYSEKGFAGLDANGDGLVSMEEMTQGFKDFLLSPDPDAPGNYIFGNWKCQNAKMAG